MNETVFSERGAAGYGRALLKRLVWTAASSCALGGLYPWRLEEEWLKVDHLPMPLAGLGKGFWGARLIHISDLHCSPIVRAGYLRRCVEVVNRLRPDFVAITGDFITVGPKRFARDVAEVLAELDPAVATLAVLGNHDYGLWHPNGLGGVRGLSGYLTDRLTAAGVIVLSNEARTFCRAGAEVQFLGLADLWARHYDPDEAFDSAEQAVPAVALVHNPDSAPELAARGAEWVLAGHTHGKRTRDNRLHEAIFPADHKHFIAGRYRLGQRRHLYVNRGLGHARRVRLANKPEITVFRLAPADVSGSRREAIGRPASVAV